MRVFVGKSVLYLVIGAGVLAVAVLGLILSGLHKEPGAEEILAAYREEAGYNKLTIRYPLDQTLFPPDIAPPVFGWEDDDSESDIWLVSIRFEGVGECMNFLTRKPHWTAEAEQWETIKELSLEKEASVTILGVEGSEPGNILSRGRISFRTSKDKVGAPLFYREVNLPFVEAVKDPTHIRWRFGTISSAQQPPIVLDKLPVCGNCHSFSADGGVLGMDVDYASDKGSYAIAGVEEKIALTKREIITWSDYRREDGEPTFGLLSQVSPDGRFVVSTVKDESVFVPKADLAFSQLFFPIKGILCIYDRQAGTYASLPGADDPQYVQSNPAWSPDGRYIVFAKTKAYQLRNRSTQRKVLLSPEECREFLEDGKPFQFDLYRIPFNDGRGGVAEPLEGASGNGMSNFFAKYSPDGKWIVFCRAANYMLLQPDSELYIIPAEGGKARRLSCNTSRMNSWHSWSPNGRWLVFSSKAGSDYTQLFLTHIDEEGYSTPPVVLSHLTAPDRAANIPEFVNAGPFAIRQMSEHFVDDISYLRAAKEFAKANDFAGAERQCRKALELNPRNAEVHCNLGLALYQQGKLDEAMKHLSESVRLDPNSAEAHYNMGQMMLKRGEPDEAIRHWLEVVRLQPDHVKAHVNAGALLFKKGLLDEAEPYLSKAVRLDPNDADAQYNLGQMMFRREKFDEAARHLTAAVQLKPEDLEARYNLGIALARQAKVDEAIGHWLEVLRGAPNHTGVLMNLAAAYAGIGQFDKAVSYAERALVLARSEGDEKLAAKIEGALRLYLRAGRPQ
jgi:tetratricopeptide (TPR) repeat protein